MNTRNALPVMVYMLTEVNFETGEGTLMIKPKYPINSEWKPIKLYVSSNLRRAIKRQEEQNKSVLNIGDTYRYCEFSSSDSSPNFNDNPFKLVHFVPTEKSDIPEHFVLRLVNEYSTFEEEVHITGVRYRKYFNKLLKPFQFKRYDKVYNTKTMEEAGIVNEIFVIR